MTEATGNSSSEEVGTPWEDKWNDVKASVKTAVEPVVKAATAPWEDMWGAAPSNVRRSPDPVPDRFDTVFNKLIGAESGGNHTDANGKITISPKGAEGITQVMPNTGDDPGYGVTPLKNKSQEEYTRFGKEYLRAMLKEFNGDYEKALAAYNAGVGNVKKAIEDGGDNWKNKLPKKSETIPYINRILGKS